MKIGLPLLTRAFPSTLQNLQQVRELSGTTGPKLVKNLQGEFFVVKPGNSPDHIREENFADAVYRALGVDVPASTLLTDDRGRPHKVAQFIEGKLLYELGAEEKKNAYQKLGQHFALDALLANWDVVGLIADNIIVNQEGVFRIDNGGALRFRAQGAQKTFDENPLEIFSMRDPKRNPSAATAFRHLSYGDVLRQVPALVDSREIICQALPKEIAHTVSRRLDKLEELYTDFQKKKAEGVEESIIALTHSQRLESPAQVPGPSSSRNTPGPIDVFTLTQILLGHAPPFQSTSNRTPVPPPQRNTLLVGHTTKNELFGVSEPQRFSFRNVPTLISDSDLTQLGGTRSGAVLCLGRGNLACMEMRIRQIEDPHGSATLFNFQLRPQEIEKLKQTPVEWSRSIFKLPEGSFQTHKTVYGEDRAHKIRRDSHLPNSFVHHREGEFSLEFLDDTIVARAYHNKVRLIVYGNTAEDRQRNFRKALETFGLSELFETPDAGYLEKFALLSVLRNFSAPKAFELSQNLENLSASAVRGELSQFGITEAHLRELRFEEVFPGHFAPVLPELGKRLTAAGVQAAMVGILTLEHAVDVLISEGLMSSVARYESGLMHEGESTDLDEKSGGAEFAFLRVIPKTQQINDKPQEMTQENDVQLICFGKPLEELLSRCDYHFYKADRFGTTQPEHLYRRESLLEHVGASTVQRNNELCVKHGVPARQFNYVKVKAAEDKERMIAMLQQKGVRDIDGDPLENRIIVASDLETFFQSLPREEEPTKDWFS